MRICTKCGTLQDEAHFYKAKHGKNGLKAECKSCSKTRDKLLPRNKEKRKEQTLAARAKNQEKVRATAAAYYRKNHEKERANKNEWKKLNKESVRIYAQNRRARRLDAGGKLSNGLAEKLYAIQRGKCACGCRQPLGNNYHLDHRMPIALGGSNTDDNMQLLRDVCNMQKGAKHPIDFMRQRGYLL